MSEEEIAQRAANALPAHPHLRGACAAAIRNALAAQDMTNMPDAIRTAEERGRRSGDTDWLRAITHWQEHPRCGVTMEQMFYDARHPEDTYPSERCDGCDPLRLLLTRALVPRDSAPACAPCKCGKMQVPNGTRGIMDFESIVHRCDACVYVGNPDIAPRDSGKEGTCRTGESADTTPRCP